MYSIEYRNSKIDKIPAYIAVKYVSAILLGSCEQLSIHTVGNGITELFKEFLNFGYKSFKSNNDTILFLPSKAELVLRVKQAGNQVLIEKTKMSEAISSLSTEELDSLYEVSQWLNGYYSYRTLESNN